MDCFSSKEKKQNNDTEIERSRNKIEYLTEMLEKVNICAVLMSNNDIQNGQVQKDPLEFNKKSNQGELSDLFKDVNQTGQSSGRKPIKGSFSGNGFGQDSK